MLRTALLTAVIVMTAASAQAGDRYGPDRPEYRDQARSEHPRPAPREDEELRLPSTFFIGGGGVGPAYSDASYGGGGAVVIVGGGGSGFAGAGSFAGARASASASASASVSARIGVRVVGGFRGGGGCR